MNAVTPMLRLIQSRQPPAVREVIAQARHAERAAMMWSATCPVMQTLAGFASSDALLLRKRLWDSIARDRREHDAFWRRVHDQETEAANGR